MPNNAEISRLNMTRHVSLYASSFAYLWLMPRKRILFRCFRPTEHVRPTIWRVATWRSIYAHQQTLSMKNSNFLISTEFEISVQLKLDKTWPSNGRIAGCKQNLREERVWDEKQKLVAVTRRDARSLRGQLPTECLFRWGLRLHWIPRRTHTAPCRPLWLLTNAIRLHFSSAGPFQWQQKKSRSSALNSSNFFFVFCWPRCSSIYRFIRLFGRWILTYQNVMRVIRIFLEYFNDFMYSSPTGWTWSN